MFLSVLPPQPKPIDVQVITHHMQRYAVWFGGSMLASTVSISNMHPHYFINMYWLYIMTGGYLLLDSPTFWLSSCVTLKGMRHFCSVLISFSLFQSHWLEVNAVGGDISLFVFSPLMSYFMWAKRIILPAGNMTVSKGLWQLIHKRLIDVKI